MQIMDWKTSKHEKEQEKVLIAERESNVVVG